MPSRRRSWGRRRLVATAGAVPVGRIAGELGWSHEHLITMVRATA